MLDRLATESTVLGKSSVTSSRQGSFAQLVDALTLRFLPVVLQRKIVSHDHDDSQKLQARMEMITTRGLSLV